ncbi:MAG TPA: ComF family protein [Ktedonobacterales bacterium]|nr:ComF family protein [Ktedonobacterales bacterium]
MVAPRAATPRMPQASLPQRALDLLFPPRCVHCRRTGEPLCAACFSAMEAPAAPRCERCDQSLGAAACPRCGACRALASGPQPPALDRIVVALRYDGATRSAIRALKFRRQRRLALPLAYHLTVAAVRAGAEVDIIIPMPLHTTRVRERGYNQAALLARPLTRTLEAPVNERILARIRATQPQTRLNHIERRANVAGAFGLMGPAEALEGKRIALVDDVTTTGATLEAAAEALRAAHPAAIYALAVARPMRSDFWPTDAPPPDL